MSGPYRVASRLVHGGQAAATRPWRRAMTARGSDVTAGSARRSSLVIAPHPDDETLGCGATIARKVAGDSPVWVLIVADGRDSHVSARISPDQLAALRAAEARSACRTLGVGEDNLRQLGWAGPLADRVDELVEVICDIVLDVRPQEILVTSGLDWHPDHQAANQAARRVVDRLGRHEVRLLEYPVWHWADGPWGRHGPRSLSRKIGDIVREPWESLTGTRPELVTTGPYLQRKRDALASYRSQLENLTGEPGWEVFDQRFLDAFLGRHELFVPGGERSA